MKHPYGLARISFAKGTALALPILASGLSSSISSADLPDELTTPGLLATVSFVPSGVAGDSASAGIASQDVALEVPVKKLTNGVLSIGGTVKGLLMTPTLRSRPVEGSLYAGVSFFGPNDQLLKINAGSFTSPNERGLRLLGRYEQGFPAGQINARTTVEVGSANLPPGLVAFSQPNNPNGPALPSNAFKRFGFRTDLYLNRLPVFAANSYLNLGFEARTEQSFDPKTLVDWDADGRLNLKTPWVGGAPSTLSFEYKGNSFGLNQGEADLSIPLYQNPKFQLSAIGTGTYSQSAIPAPVFWTRDAGLKVAYIPRPSLFTSLNGTIGQSSNVEGFVYKLSADLRYKLLKVKNTPELFSKGKYEKDKFHRRLQGEAGVRFSTNRLKVSLAGSVERVQLASANFNTPLTYGLKSEVSYQLGQRRDSELYVSADLKRRTGVNVGEVEAGLLFSF